MGNFTFSQGMQLIYYDFKSSIRHARPSLSIRLPVCLSTIKMYEISELKNIRSSSRERSANSYFNGLFMRIRYIYALYIYIQINYLLTFEGDFLFI